MMELHPYIGYRTRSGRKYSHTGVAPRSRSEVIIGRVEYRKVMGETGGPRRQDRSPDHGDREACVVKMHAILLCWLL